MFQSGKNVIMAMAAYFIYAIWMFNFGLYPRIKLLASGSELPEESFGYSSESVLLFVSSIGERGESIYFYFQILDLINAFLFAVTLVLVLEYFAEKFFSSVKIFVVSFILPGLLFILEVLENALLLLIVSYQNIRFIEFASWITVLKLSLATVLLVAVVALVLIYILQLLRLKLKQR